MDVSIYVYDPTAQDALSKVRGIGRYMQTLRENIDGAQFTSDLSKVPRDSILINPFFNLISKSKIGGRIARKQIAIIHDLIPLKYPKEFPIGLKGAFYKFLNSRSLKNYDVVVTDSNTSKKDIIFFLKLPESKIQVIYPTVPKVFLPHLQTDVKSSHPFHRTDGHSVPVFSTMSPGTMFEHPDLVKLQEYVLYVGDATWNKNLGNLQEAIKMTKLTCVCVGRVFDQNDISKLTHPWQQPLAQFLKNVGNDTRFVLPGYVSDTELLALYQRAQANILISYDEGFGLSFIEAGYAGAPSVLSDIPIFHEIAGDSAIFVNPKDPKDIATKIVQLAFDRMKNEEMRIKAFDRAQDFNPVEFKENWNQLLNKLT